MAFFSKQSIILLYVCQMFTLSSAVTRTYYVAAIEVLWDYASTGRNLMNGKLLNEDADAAVFTKNSSTRIGKVYKKAVYREYTDMTFTLQKPRDKTLGILGPVVRGGAGDVILIYFKNLASRSFTVHAHTVFYGKESEGAVYEDSTTGNYKLDDGVIPGKIQKYTWIVTKAGTPADGDPNCLTWLYHSHVKPTPDINSGPVGMIETCKAGILKPDGTRNDVEKEYYLLFMVLDENKSWYFDENLKLNGIDPTKIDKTNEDFKESNLLHSVNGKFYGNIFGFDVCQGDKVAWHISVLGTETDMHTISFHGNTVISDHHRTNMRALFPAHSGTVLMHANNAGHWLMECKITDHWKAGMFAFYNVSSSCGLKINKTNFSGVTREYFIMAEEMPWNYGSTLYNSYDGGLLNQTGSTSATFFTRGPNRIGGTYLKTRYCGFTDATFTKRKPRTLAERKHLGFLGPVIKAEVGDRIKVVFHNKLSINASIHPNGVLYNKSHEGSLYEDGTNKRDDDIVPPGGTYTYEWTIPDSMAPTSQDTPCIVWLYSSSVNPIKDTYSGMVGPLITCKRGSLKANGIPQGYDAEKYLFTAVMDENESWLLEKNMDAYCTSPKCGGISKENEDFKESNKMHQINGFMYGDLGIELCKDEKVIWYGLAIGTEIDLHSIYFTGNDIEVEGNHKDSVMIFPGPSPNLIDVSSLGGSTTFSMVPDNIGTWSISCAVNDHYNAGMKFTYKVDKCNAQNVINVSTKKRTYYIGIIELEWDYAPNNLLLTDDTDLYTDSNAKTYTKRASTTIGKIYKKAKYVEYTDATFTKRTPTTERTQHLGILGPFIMAEEGEEIVVVAKNMASRNYSVHPHGVLYTKDNEGASYKDGTNHKGKAIAPGKTYTYHWFVPKRAAPGPNDGPCLTWAYFSALHPVKDTNSGLIGPLITCRKGTLTNGLRNDINKEFALLFTVLDENESWYLDENINKFALEPKKVDKTDEDFKESNKMNAINGYIYSNGPNKGSQYEMFIGEKVAWYLIGFGNEADIHTVHFHGNSFYHKTNSKHVDDVFDIFPGIFSTLEMTPVNPGKWLLHCHVNDHKKAGMETIFNVKRKMTTDWGDGNAANGICFSPYTTFFLIIIIIWFL